MTVSLSMTQDPEAVGECYLVSESSAESIANGVQPILNMPAYVQIDKSPEPTGKFLHSLSLDSYSVASLL